MVNSRVGYVYLVDQDLKVRWAACADAKAEEAEALESCTGVLLGRYDSKLGRANSEEVGEVQSPHAGSEVGV